MKKPITAGTVASLAFAGFLTGTAQAATIVPNPGFASTFELTTIFRAFTG